MADFFFFAGCRALVPDDWSLISGQTKFYQVVLDDTQNLMPSLGLPPSTSW